MSQRRLLTSMFSGFSGLLGRGARSHSGHRAHYLAGWRWTRPGWAAGGVRTWKGVGRPPRS